MELQQWEKEIAKKLAKLKVWTSRLQKYPFKLTYTRIYIQSPILSSLEV